MSPSVTQRLQLTSVLGVSLWLSPSELTSQSVTLPTVYTYKRILYFVGLVTISTRQKEVICSTLQAD